MFCPKCGSPNQDDIAYCRECGENLQVVSQAMKGYLPVTLVSKIDAIFEKKNERFRRDAILNAFIGFAYFFAGVFGLIAGGAGLFFDLFWAAIGVVAFGAGIWKMLAYRRSLELKNRIPQIPIALNESQLSILPDSIIPVSTEPEAIKVDDVFVYCPKCGLQHSKPISFCSSCGIDIEAMAGPTGIERYLPQFLITRLDVAVATNEATPFKPQYESGSTLLIVSIAQLLFAIFAALSGNRENAIVYAVLGITTFIGGGWNLIAYRRTTTKENLPLDLSTPAIEDEIMPYFRNEWKTVLVLLGVSCGIVLYFGILQGLPLALVALLILAGSYLRFWQKQRDAQFRTNEAAMRESLKPPNTPETWALRPEPLSVTEPTTRLLDPLMDQIEREKVPTTRELVDPR